jgi:ribosome biogenesis GTPase
MQSSSPPASDPHYNATVITHFGNELLIQAHDGERLRAVPRQNLPALATGDRIHYEAGDGGHAVIDKVATRHGILTRQTRHQEKLIAVNIDKVLIVCAAKPALKTGLIDRYLVACELADLAATIVFNKTDLLNSAKLKAVKETLALYSDIGYPVQYVSAKTGEGIEDLRNMLMDSISVLVGHSAVGKSSLIKALLPTTNPRIGQVSKTTNKGQHTTTHTELYQLNDDSMIIDSPGIREFGLKSVDAQQLAQGFREFTPFVERCKFRDCTHTREPGCAIQQAIAEGKIRAERVESYRVILESFKIN